MVTNGNGRAGAVLNREQFEARMMGHIDNMQGMLENALSSRTEFFRRQLLDPRRNLDADCGYPDPNTLDAWFYRDLYDREPVAERVVSLMPKECWQISPEVYEDEDPDETTPFEDAWDNLPKQLRGDGSYFQDEEGSPIWEYMYRGDKLSGIGNFGVILLGFDDGRPLYEPVEGVVTQSPDGTVPVGNMAYEVSVPQVSPEDAAYAKRTEGARRAKLTVNFARTPASFARIAQDRSGPGLVMKDGSVSPVSSLGTDAQYFEPLAGPTEFPAVRPSGRKRKLLFMRVFDHSLVQVSQYEGNMLNPRFGQPVMYRVTLNDQRDFQFGGAGLSLNTVQVHWSRIQHLADNLNASEVMGAPRMRPVLNPILDVKKVRGGSAEMYWKGAFPGIALSTHPQLGGDVPVDESSMKDMMENYFNTLQRYMLLVGMSANSISPTVVDPEKQINAQVEAICIQLGCPVRVFRGSERGELASTQDDSAWNDRLRHRQNNYITPRIIVPFVDRLILVGVLPVPKKRRTDSPQRPTIPEQRAKLSSQEPERGAPKAFSRNAESGKLEMPNEDAKKDETKGGYSVRWPDLDSLGEKDRAAISQQYTTALAAYVSGGVEALVPPKSFLTHFVNFDEEEAQAIIDEAERFQEDEMEKHGDLAEMGEEHELVPTPPVGFEQKPEPPVIAPGMPGGPPMDPVKMKDGEALVQPDTGKTVAKFTRNEELPESDTDTLPEKEQLDLVKKRLEWLMGLDEEEADEIMTLNWCNQYGGTTCRDGGGRAGKGKSDSKGSNEGLHGNPEFKKGSTAAAVAKTVPTPKDLIKTLKDRWKDRMETQEGEYLAVAFKERLAGACEDACKEMKADLKAQGIETKLVGGHYLTHDGYIEGHFVLQAKDGTVIDPTESQFRRDVKPGQVRIYPKGNPSFSRSRAELVKLRKSRGQDPTQNEEWPTVFNQEELAEVENKVGPTIRGQWTEDSEVVLQNCGGPGSGVPGPCPSGVPSHEVHIETLKAISDEFTKGGGGRDEVMARVDQVLAGLSKEQLKEAAAKFGSRSAKGRKERVEAIKRFISDRREMYRRTLHNMVENGWVTTDSGQHIFIGEGGEVQPSGPKEKKSKGKEDGHADVGTTPEGKERDKTDKTINHPDVLKHLKVPEKMYHVTSEANLKSILKDGLKFGSPRASKEGEIRGVYLTDDPHDIGKQGGDVGGGKTVTLEVSTKGLNLRLDPEYFYYDDKSAAGARKYVEAVNSGEDLFALYSPRSIPASAIRVTRNKEVSHGEPGTVPEDAEQGGKGKLPPTVREEI